MNKQPEHQERIRIRVNHFTELNFVKEKVEKKLTMQKNVRHISGNSHQGF